MQKLIGLVLIALSTLRGEAQELFVSTEPASNMAAGSIGLRLNTWLFKMETGGSPRYRLNPELMLGINKRLMLHLNLYASDVYQPALRWEGAGIYAKYRFYSSDDVQSHFRIAGFSKISLVDNPVSLQSGNLFYSGDEIDLDGNNSGLLAGLVATQLIHKLALSSSFAFTSRWDNLDAAKLPGQAAEAVNYTFSAGYLLWPPVYRNFRQTNINIYTEFLGSSSLDKKSYYLDVAPAIQFIFNSISRLDFSWRVQLAGNMERLSTNQYFVRFEYNFLNAFKNR
jgi:hypothetical protein